MTTINSIPLRNVDQPNQHVVGSIKATVCKRKCDGFSQSNSRKKLALVGLMAIIAIFSITACDGDDGSGSGGNSGGGGNGGGDFTPEYELGDTAPGGGKIFYISEAGFTMTDTNEVCHYLEAAPNNMATNLAWASEDYIFTDITDTETAIGTGRKNTALILATDSNAPAAKACNNYTNNGKSDWFLPSKDELNELYVNRESVGNMGTERYWSSSQNNWYWSSSHLIYEFAWRQDFNDGSQYDNYYKTNWYTVRAVRAF